MTSAVAGGQCSVRARYQLDSPLTTEIKNRTKSSESKDQNVIVADLLEFNRQKQTYNNNQNEDKSEGYNVGD